MDKSYLKSSEIAKLFNVDHSTVFLWVKKKHLRPIKTPGGNYRFAKSDVERLFHATRVQDVSEKRKYPRFAVSFPVEVSEGSALSEKVPASLSDVSLGGLGLTINKDASLYDNIRSGSTKVLRVYDVDSGIFKPEMEAEIRHVRDIDEEKAFVGLLLRK